MAPLLFQKAHHNLLQCPVCLVHYDTKALEHVLEGCHPHQTTSIIGRLSDGLLLRRTSSDVALM